MFYDTGCYGRVELGVVPAAAKPRLTAVPGEWLEYDPETDAIVVRHIQPSSAPSLPTIAGELVRLLAELPMALRTGIRGGDFFVHTERTAQLVRLRVEPGGAVHIRWAHPSYAAAAKRAYQRGREHLVDPRVQRLNGQVSLRVADPGAAATAIETCADTYEGLYPEGECRIRTLGADAVQVDLLDVNLDAELLLDVLTTLAAPGSLTGRIEVASFAGQAPEHDACFVAEDGVISVQRPVLWDTDH